MPILLHIIHITRLKCKLCDSDQLRIVNGESGMCLQCMHFNQWSSKVLEMLLSCKFIQNQPRMNASIEIEWRFCVRCAPISIRFILKRKSDLLYSVWFVRFGWTIDFAGNHLLCRDVKKRERNKPHRLFYGFGQFKFIFMTYDQIDWI